MFELIHPRAGGEGCQPYTSVPRQRVLTDSVRTARSRSSHEVEQAPGSLPVAPIGVKASRIAPSAGIRDDIPHADTPTLELDRHQCSEVELRVPRSSGWS